jgi:hypothetical protein
MDNLAVEKRMKFTYLSVIKKSSFGFQALSQTPLYLKKKLIIPKVQSYRGNRTRLVLRRLGDALQAQYVKRNRRLFPLFLFVSSKIN